LQEFINLTVSDVGYIVFAGAGKKLVQGHRPDND
jgi:hypothetical protein